MTPTLSTVLTVFLVIIAAIVLLWMFGFIHLPLR